MKVQVHPADEGGCGYYRAIWPAQAVQAGTSRLDVQLCMPDTPEGGLHLLKTNTPDGPRVVGLDQVPDCDVMVLQRPLQRDLADAIPHLQRAGVAVVVELDDHFKAIHHRNAAHLNTQPRTSPDRNWQHLITACHHADLVTCTTPKLAEVYGRHGRVQVLPNYLPGHLWRPVQPATQGTSVLLGWTGSVMTHPTDLQQCAWAVRNVLELDHVSLGVVGTGVGVAPALGLGMDHRVVDGLEEGQDPYWELGYPMDTTGWVELADYPTAVSRFHAGVVPLDLTPFNEAKSHLKGLEMAAAGVPFVAAPTGPYRDLATSTGIGLVARKPGQWGPLLRRLVEDHPYRAELAAAWRQQVLDSLLYEHHAELWELAWTEARVTWQGRRRTVVA